MATVQLSWTDNSSNEDGFRIYRSTTSSPSFPADYSEIATVGANTTTYDDTAAPDGETVHYAVTAYNDAGESSETTQSIETIAAPTIGTPFADSNSEIVVPWTREDDSSDGSHEVERATNGGSFSTVASGLAASTTEYSTGTPVPDTDTYTYRVRRIIDSAEAVSGTADVFVDYAVTITGTNSPVEAGQTLDVDVEVANNGTIEGDQTLELLIEEQ